MYDGAVVSVQALSFGRGQVVGGAYVHTYAHLHLSFGPTKNYPHPKHTQLYKRRGEVQAQVEAGTYTFDFLPETAHVRQVGAWGW